MGKKNNSLCVCLFGRERKPGGGKGAGDGEMRSETDNRMGSSSETHDFKMSCMRGIHAIYLRYLLNVDARCDKKFAEITH